MLRSTPQLLQKGSRMFMKNSLMNHQMVINFFMITIQTLMRYFGSVIKVKLGDIGEGTKEAKLKKWHVTEG
jgi:hypothetical protein